MPLRAFWNNARMAWDCPFPCIDGCMPLEIAGADA